MALVLKAPQDLVAHLVPVAPQDQVEHQDQVARERLAQVVLGHQAPSQDSRQPEGQAQVAAAVAVLALPEPLVRVVRRASPESQSAQSARNLNKEKHRA